MIEDALRKFAQENFNNEFYPVLLGETENIQPLTLVIKTIQPRHGRLTETKVETVILAELAKYVKHGEEVDAFHKSKIKEEMLSLKQEHDTGARTQDLDVCIPGYTEKTIKSNDDQAVLKLGKLSQKYIDDPDLREILAHTTLDANKMKNFERNELLLITTVICSEKFELEGKRKRKTEVAAENWENTSPFAKFFRSNATTHPSAGTYIPPEFVSRTSEAPILFKCCQVDFMKENNRLEIRKGEYVGKTVPWDRSNYSSTERDSGMCTCL